MQRISTSRSGPKPKIAQTRTPEDCLRRAALAEAYAARVDLDIAHNRLLELAAWWREQARALMREPRSFAGQDETPAHSEPPQPH
jgi:hypothetical protein